MKVARNRLTKYLLFAQAHPALFENPPQGGFSILLDEHEIRRVEAELAKSLVGKGLPPEWAHVGVVYQDQYLLILRDAVRFPDGEVNTYIRIVDNEDSVSGVAILPIYDKGVILTRHHRHATRSWHLEIPRGFGTKGVPSEETARRELSEEMDTTASRLISLGQMHVDTGLTSQCVDLFYADITSVGRPEAHEAISELLPVALSEFEQLIRRGEITDPSTIVAYTRARLYGLLSSSSK
jgi:ADP-ribose pyrophosphatase